MTDRPDDPMTEPTPDRGVSDDVRSLTIDQLIDGFAVNTGKEPFSRVRVDRARVLRAELVRRLAATERPADDLGIAYALGAKRSRNDDLTQEEYAKYCRLFPDSPTAKLERTVHGKTRIESALSAAGDGEPTDG